MGVKWGRLAVSGSVHTSGAIIGCCKWLAQVGVAGVCVVDRLRTLERLEGIDWGSAVWLVALYTDNPPHTLRCTPWLCLRRIHTRTRTRAYTTSLVALPRVPRDTESD